MKAKSDNDDRDREHLERAKERERAKHTNRDQKESIRRTQLNEKNRSEDRSDTASRQSS